MILGDYLSPSFVVETMSFPYNLPIFSLVILPFAGEILYLIAYVCILASNPKLSVHITRQAEATSMICFHHLFSGNLRSPCLCCEIWLTRCQCFQDVTWWLIPRIVSEKTPVISGLTLLVPFTTGIITHLLSGISHQVVYFLHYNFQLFYLFWGCFPVKHAGNPWARYLPAPFLRLELLRVPARAKPTRRLKTSKDLGDHRWLSPFSVLTIQ